MVRPMRVRQERRVVLLRPVSGQRVICAVRRRHEQVRGDLSFVVTEFHEGLREAQATCVVHVARASSTCGETYPCLHAKATWVADPTLLRYRPTSPTT